MKEKMPFSGIYMHAYYPTTLSQQTWSSVSNKAPTRYAILDTVLMCDMLKVPFSELKSAWGLMGMTWVSLSAARFWMNSWRSPFSREINM